MEICARREIWFRPPAVHYRYDAARKLTPRIHHKRPMMTFKRYAQLVLFLAPFLAAPAYAQWAPQVYTTEYEACVPPCDKNNPTSHGQCVSYCHCVMDAMQSQFPDHDALERAATQEKRPDSIASLQKIANTCNQKAFGAPARPLEFK